MTTHTQSPAKNLHLGLLFHLTNQFKDQLIGHYFSGAGITAPQFKVLINIYKGNTSPAEICKSLLMDTGAMSRMVERMVKSGLIERHRNAQDKRQVILALTEKGQSLCNTFQNEALNTILAELTARLTAEESQQLQALIIKMLPDEYTAPHR
ncbi:MarR family transcriptional regulator [Scandinavium sp. V105_16]|jgi:MarR family multiple antibiotic resistance transcriptional regulator|uniref:MarR family transcriptional regulator n=1 Tax=Scandinavium lactucae TaxID=3095028 RepID=A0AAJ2S5Q2_9ENTR|nr:MULTISPECIES: MarR family transcriptional regulator [unclassified Scandinavium]MDX6019260.1 MarR family transcriptional regulator [Scandinavium sp. V105_16]MDX6030584.1 MarR family transcriptional regulator [Scandinavium sp. V105_12]MDX6040457.1 MarR family transcriptional regulator [Scandinavium sp. V105_6]MDX6048840.1 MarR family transcriptional regulator [Scandinavium sp. V105_1]